MKLPGLLPVTSSRRLRTAVVLAALVTAGAAAGPTAAEDPDRWLDGRATTLPTLFYFQGVTADPARRLTFTGVLRGLYRTDARLREQAARPDAIPAGLPYNHVGDHTWDAAEGGRLVLPLECYTPGAEGDGNTCGTGAFTVSDPTTLAPRYTVELDPTAIKKAMWVEAAENGDLWTSSGTDLLVYDGAQVSPARAASGVPILPVRVLPDVLPTGSITGAAWWQGRLYVVSGFSDRTAFRMWSIDPATGAATLEAERPDLRGESEGLAVYPMGDGILQWQVQPIGGRPTHSRGVLIALRPAASPDLTVRLAGAAPRRRLTVRNAGHAATGGTIVLRHRIPRRARIRRPRGAGWTCRVARRRARCTTGRVAQPGSPLPSVTLIQTRGRRGLSRSAVRVPGDWVTSNDVVTRR